MPDHWGVQITATQFCIHRHRLHNCYKLLLKIVLEFALPCSQTTVQQLRTCIYKHCHHEMLLQKRALEFHTSSNDASRAQQLKINLQPTQMPNGEADGSSAPRSWRWR